MVDLIITVPPPPSTNALWAHVPGKARVRSRKYSAWIEVAGWEVRRQMAGRPPVDCRFDAKIQVPISGRDTDNWTKPLLDILEKAGAVTNDGNMHTVNIEPMDRQDCAIALTMLPDMDRVREAPRPRGLPKRAVVAKPGPRFLVGKRVVARLAKQGILI